MQSLKQILKFIQKAEELKSLMRHSWLSTGRRESVAEHSWRAALLAIVLAPEMENKINVGKVVMLLTVHDIVEIYAGDPWAWKGKPKNKKLKEAKAIKKLVKLLPQKQAREIAALWQEYEERKTKEAMFAKAVDKLETLDQHNLADLKTWTKEEYGYNLVHGSEEVKYSKTLQTLKNLVDNRTRAKIGKK
jgi:putative hydrolase of HD superfamily